MQPYPDLLDLPDGITHFYRYSTTTHLQWLKPVILEHKIYIPTAKQLNDPRECKPRFLDLSARDTCRFLKHSHYERHPNLTLEERAKVSGEVDLLLKRPPQETLRLMADVLYERTERTRVFSM